MFSEVVSTECSSSPPLVADVGRPAGSVGGGSLQLLHGSSSCCQSLAHGHRRMSAALVEQASGSKHLRRTLPIATELWGMVGMVLVVGSLECSDITQYVLCSCSDSR